jgi:hypothetical protein
MLSTIKSLTEQCSLPKRGTESLQSRDCETALRHSPRKVSTETG